MKIFYLIAFTLLLAACKDRETALERSSANSKTFSKEELQRRSQLTLSPSEYRAWVKDKENNLLYSKTIDNVNFAVLYKPHDFIVCNELRKEEISQGDYVKTKSQLGDMQYFDLRITIKNYQKEFLKYNISSGADYESRLNYCAFQMQRDIELIEGSDTIPCTLFHFERAFDTAPYGEFILGFEKGNSSSSEKTFIFHDKIFEKGIIKFNYQSEALTHLPKLYTL